jgi:hypothetical protein
MPGFLSYADVMDLLSCSRQTVRRLWKRGVIPPPHEVEGLGPRWWEDEIYGYLYRLRAEKRASAPPPVKGQSGQKMGS